MDERLAENSDKLGKLLRSELQRIPSERITTVSLQGSLHCIGLHEVLCRPGGRQRGHHEREHLTIVSKKSWRLHAQASLTRWKVEHAFLSAFLC